ncbi:MAG: YceI family protein [Chitinophagales bacterium]
MKKFLQFFVALIIVGSMTACQSAPDAPKADAKEVKEAPAPAKAVGQEFQIDTKQSSVTFIGTKPVGQHTGVIRLSGESNLTVINNAITAGKFDMDLTSFQITDIKGEGAQKLATHLQSNDFFDVAQFPTASFEITSVKPSNPDPNAENKVAARATHTVSGNLTLKGVTKGIDFPAILKIEANGVKGMANFNIDRTQWGLTYGNDQSLGDRFIKPEVNIQLMIVTGGKTM